jgi:uncharacterized protein (TIGR02246 family)
MNTMNKLLSTALLAVTMLSLPLAHAKDAAAEAAIRAIVADQAAAWNAGDATRFAARMAPDASFTNLSGVVMYGAPAFTSQQNEILSAVKGATKVHTLRRIRFITPDVAIADIDNEVRGVKLIPGLVPPDGVVRKSLMEVFALRNGQWWIVAFHNVGEPVAKP